MHMSRNPPFFISNTMVRIALFVYFNQQMIAAISEDGGIVWRDMRYPLFLVEYLLTEKDHYYQWN
jgi:hypothetical protein